MASYPKSELLTVEQFAQRLQVSRTTVFKWLKEDKLQEGVHYFRIDRTLRFYWPFYIDIDLLMQTDGNVECKSTDFAQLQKKRHLGKAKLQHEMDGITLRCAREVLR